MPRPTFGMLAAAGLVLAFASTLSACQSMDAGTGSQTGVTQQTVSPNAGSADSSVTSPSSGSGDRVSASTNPSSGDADSAPLQLSIGQGVYGRVMTANGSPVANVMVTAEAISPASLTIPELAVMTSSSGLFEWPLQPGTYELSVTAPGGGRMARQVTVGTGVTRLDIVLR
jgi:Carboxypeptidase regulatory-like domain